MTHLRIFTPKQISKWDILRNYHTMASVLKTTTAGVDAKIKAYAKTNGISFYTAFSEMAMIAVDIEVSKALRAEQQLDHTFGY